MKVSEWKTALIDIDRASEFVGDDVDQYSKIVDLDENYEFLTVHVPTGMDSATLTPYVQKGEKVTRAAGYFTPGSPAVVGDIPFPVHFFNDISADTDVIQSTIASTGGISITFRIGGYQYIRIKASANQDPDVELSVRGFNR